MKRIISLLLALVLLCALVPAAQAAPVQGFTAAAGSNPLYPHQQVPEIPLAPQALPRPVQPNANFEPPSLAAPRFRDAMENRETSITLHLAYDDPDFDPNDDIIPELMELAFAETGVPTEGDSLRWVWNTYNASWSWSYVGSLCLIKADIDMTYYTTAAQEQTLTQKVSQIRKSLGFTAETNDYQKVKAIYDYITANVDYDYDNLEDPDHKLKYTAYAAACQGTAVCQGYAVLLYRLLLEEDICARVITGWSGESHAWNIVELENKFYNCDSTWDAGFREYSWFLRTPADFPDHQRNPEYDTSAFHKAYPMATADYQPPHVHTFTDWTVTDPTCTLDGSRTRTCTGCGHLESILLPAPGHDYTTTTVLPTCETAGFTSHTCRRCGDTYTDNHVEALGHDWDEGYVTIDPDPVVPGLLVYTCRRCALAREESLAPHDHGYTQITELAPGCTTGGCIYHACPGCGHFFTTDHTAPLGHSWRLDRCQRCMEPRPNPFSDTAEGSFYYLPVLWALDEGITTGTSDTTFSPGTPCQRAQVVTFLYRYLSDGGPAGISGVNRSPFTDVKPGDFYYDPVMWAVETGITAGTSETTFSPFAPCSRAQVVTFLWRSAGSPEPQTSESPFEDVTGQDFYFKAVLWAVEQGITNGIDANHFDPFAVCNRAQVVTFLWRSAGQPQW